LNIDVAQNTEPLAFEGLGHLADRVIERYRQFCAETVHRVDSLKQDEGLARLRQSRDPRDLSAREPLGGWGGRPVRLISESAPRVIYWRVGVRDPLPS
jgi:hypothetical protein